MFVYFYCRSQTKPYIVICFHIYGYIQSYLMPSLFHSVNDVTFHIFSGVACLSMNVTDSRGITIHVTPDRKEMGFLNHALNKNLEEATHVKNAAQSYDLSGIKISSV